MARKARDKQGRLPDMEEPSIPAIDKAADAYAAARDQRMEILKEEIDLQEKLKPVLDRSPRSGTQGKVGRCLLQPAGLEGPAIN